MENETQLLAKVKRLESLYLRITWVGGLLFVFVAVISLWGRMGSKDSISVREVLIKDEAGRVVAKLGTNDLSGTCLQLKSKEEGSAAELCVGDAATSSLMLSTHRGATRAFLSAGSRLYENGGVLSPGLLIADADGEKLVSATLGAETKLIIGRGTENNSVVIAAPPTKPTIKLLGGEGKPLWTAP